MQNKKRIIVFSEAERAITATAIKEILLDYSKSFEVILVDIMELSNRPLVDFFSNMLTIDVNVERIEAKLKKRMAYRNIHKLLKPDLSVKNISSYRNMENILLRYSPVLVILVGTGAVIEVSAMRQKLGLDFKIVTLVDDYVLNRNLIYEYVDAYIVENIGVKTSLVNNYVPERKIHLSSIPIMKVFSQSNLKKKVLEYRPNIPTLTLIVTPNDKAQYKWQLDILSKYKDNYNIFVFIDGNNGALDKAASSNFRVVSDYSTLNELYEVSDILLICPYSPMIEPAFLKGKLVALSAPNNELEENIFEELTGKIVPCENEHRLSYFLDKYPREEYEIIRTNAKKQTSFSLMSVFEKFLN